MSHDRAAKLQFELGFDFLQRRLEQLGARLGVDLVAEQLAGGLDGDVDGACADFVDRLALGLGDLLLGKRGAARDIVLGLLLRFVEQHVGFALGRGDDVGGFLLGFLALALIFGQQLLASSRRRRASSSSSRMRSARASSALAIMPGTLR